MATQRKLMTTASFHNLAALPENRERLLELVQGEVTEKMPTEEHGAIVANILTELRTFLKSHPVGRVATEVQHQLPDDPYNARRPDITFMQGNRSPVKRGPVPAMPDFAVEVKSPDDSLRQLREKAEYYLQHGTQMVWLVYPEKQLVEVFTAEAVEILTAADTIEGGDTLPGFRLAVATIFQI